MDPDAPGHRDFVESVRQARQQLLDRAEKAVVSPERADMIRWIWVHDGIAEFLIEPPVMLAGYQLHKKRQTIPFGFNADQFR